MSRLQVEVQCGDELPALPPGLELARWAEAALLPGQAAAELALRIVGAAEGAALNGQFRQRQGPTNVLSFPAEPLPGQPDGLPRMLGDIVLCAPVVAEQAEAQHKPLSAHYAHLCVHGMLHLQGHDHEQAEAAAEMEALEVAILAELGFPDPYQLPT